MYIVMMNKETVMKKRGATVKYRLYGKLDFEKKFNTVKDCLLYTSDAADEP